VDGPPLEIRADRLRIDQAVGSVVDNALRYGAGEVSVALTAAAGNTVEVRVRDHGSGFPPDFLARAFERFSRSSASSDGGSGLGLAIVRTVVRAHGGEACAANAGDGGAEVRLSLPRSLSGAPPSTALSSAL
jgi:signal transduction histidine kinase